MTISLLTLTLLLGATSLGVAQQIDSPRALIQCQPVDLTFSEGQAPYAIDVIPSGQAGADVLETIQAATSPVTWIVDVPAGSNVTLALKDSSNRTSFTRPLVVQPPPQDAGAEGDSCLTAQASVAASTATADPTEPRRGRVASESALETATVADESPVATATVEEEDPTPSPTAEAETQAEDDPSATPTPAPTPQSPEEIASASSASAASASSMSDAMSSMDAILAGLPGGIGA